MRETIQIEKPEQMKKTFVQFFGLKNEILFLDQ